MISQPKPTSPKRRALHERSDSHTNASASVRLVKDDSAHIYLSNPYPTQPSHVLSPSHRQGLRYEGDEAVSDKIKPFANSPRSRKPTGNGKERPITKTGSNTFATGSPSTFDGSSSAPNHSPITTPASSSPTRLRSTADLGTDLEERVSDEIIQLPSIPQAFTPTCSASLPESPTLAPALRDITDITVTDRMSSKPSEESISSSATTGTVQHTRPTDRPSRASYVAFPPSDRPTPSRSARSVSAPFASSNSGFNYPDDHLPSTSQRYPPLAGRRISSVPSQTDIQAAIDSGANLQYPTIRPPSVSGSWADTSISVPKRTARTHEQDAPRRWNPHLSTVHSELTDENGNEGFSLPAQYGLPGTITPSKAVENQSGASDALEPPRPLFPRNRDGTGSTIRVVTEDDNKPKDAQPQTLRSRASGVLSVLSSSSVKRKKSLKSGEVRTEPGSRGSFLRDSIPAWARIHYARGSQSSFPSPPSSSEGPRVPHRNVSPVAENVPSTIHRPRNRPHQGNMPRRGSMEIAPVAQVEEAVEIRGPPWRRLSDIWSPRLPHDKRTVKRSVWKAPSFDEKAENNPFSRRNLQILMFVVGFTLPFAWMIASFLPLPPRPVVGQEKTTGTPDIEQAMDENVGPINESRYQNARWWRNVNRIMSIVGFLLLVTIIVLAVVAARTQDL